MKTFISFIGIVGAIYTEISLCIITCGLAYGSAWFIENIKDKEECYIKKNVNKTSLILLFMVAIKMFFEIFFEASILRSNILYLTLVAIFGFSYGRLISNICNINLSSKRRKSARNEFYFISILSSVIWIVSYFI